MKKENKLAVGIAMGIAIGAVFSGGNRSYRVVAKCWQCPWYW
jgi:hypothetical protein